MARDYQQENKYKSQPAQIKARVERNRARRIMQAVGLVHKGDGKEVDHIKPISKGGATTKANLRVVSASENDSFKRNSKKQLVSQTSTREAKASSNRRGRKS